MTAGDVKRGAAPMGAAPDPDARELSCEECGRLFAGRAGWLPICPDCFSDIRAGVRPARNRHTWTSRRRAR